MSINAESEAATPTAQNAAAPAPEESAVSLFQALVRHHAAGRVTLSFDFRRLHHMDCPIAVEADGNRIAYAIVAAVLIAVWRGGWWWAGGVLAAGVVLYYTIGRIYIRSRIRKRIEDRVFASLDLWQRLWRFGGIGLVPADGGAPCLAPQGNWVALVRQLQATERAASSG